MLSFAMILMRETIGGAQARRRRRALAQHAVDAVAHREAVLERLDMDVGGAALDGARDQQVDEPDDRRLAGEVAQPVDVLVRAGILGILDLVDDLAERTLLAAIEALMGELDVGWRGDADLDRLAGRAARASAPGSR